MKCHLCEKEATWSESPLGNPDELALCDEHYKKVHKELHKAGKRIISTKSDLPIICFVSTVAVLCAIAIIALFINNTELFTIISFITFVTIVVFLVCAFLFWGAHL